MFCHQNCTKHFRRRGLSSRPPAVEKTAPCDEKFFLHYLGIYAILDRQSTCRCSSMAECQLPKLNTRVRFPSPAPCKKPRKVLIFKNFSGFFVLSRGGNKNRLHGGSGGFAGGSPVGLIWDLLVYCLKNTHFHSFFENFL